ncbi:MAG: spermidine synthase [Alphaproteobacteria bacterium]|nr:spermidine synthase [Alphaproteobacteria bacterium]
MSAWFEELDYRPTAIGAVSLRRRHDPLLGETVLEIKLDDEFLMSSAFTASEEALARLGLAAARGAALSVVVGGLGLGYTAKTVLDDPAVERLFVVDFLAPVIDWHRRGLIPLGADLMADPRCHFVEGDFFALASSADGFLPECPGRKHDVILVDIDHSPEALLDARSEAFYSKDGLAALTRHLKPGGVFGLWSNDGPADAFLDILREVFAEASADIVRFPNPYQKCDVTQTVYRAWKAR